MDHVPGPTSLGFTWSAQKIPVPIDGKACWTIRDDLRGNPPGSRLPVLVLSLLKIPVNYWTFVPIAVSGLPCLGLCRGTVDKELYTLTFPKQAFSNTLPVGNWWITP